MPFNLDEFDREDFRLMQNSSVVLYCNKAFFEDDLQMLSGYGYQIHRISCVSMAVIRREFSRVLKWKEQFGYELWTGNLDAFNDGLRARLLEDAPDNVFALEDFHCLAKEEPEFAARLLDIIERKSRDYLLFGRRLVSLVRTDDAGFSCEVIGGTSAQWNRREWFTADRGP